MTTPSSGPKVDDWTRRAIHAWSAYSESAESLVHLSHEGLTLQVTLPDVLRSAGVSEDDGRLIYAEHCAKYAKREVDTGFATVHAHALLGMWGALESLVEDLFVAALRRDPALLARDAFAKIKLPVGTLLVDEEDRLRAVLVEASRNTDLAHGVTRFGRLLARVGLSGPVPEAIRDSVYRAQQIRNVWAHRGGVADARFVRACPDLGFAVGSSAMPPAVFMQLLHGLHMYGGVLMLRIGAVQGVAIPPGECQGYEGVLDELLANPDSVVARPTPDDGPAVSVRFRAACTPSRVPNARPRLGRRPRATHSDARRTHRLGGGRLAQLHCQPAAGLARRHPAPRARERRTRCPIHTT